MAIKNILVGLAAAALVWMLAPSASAQRFDPFIEPGHFEPDFQFFAPAQVPMYGDKYDPNVGFFFTYDRMHIGVSRPEGIGRDFQSDWTWGNRYDLGFMTEEGHGWLFSGMHIDGPNMVENEARFNNVELNRVWRLKPLHHGSYVEPFVGVRYMEFKDFTGDMVQNNIVGGQLGVRWFKKQGHWLLSAEGRLTPGINFQHFDAGSLDEFAMSGEVRVDAKYEITRDFGVRVGWNFIHFGKGIARNNNFLNNSEDLTMTGVTFGFDFNR